MVQRLPKETVIVPIQVLGELFNVLVKKLRWRAIDVSEEIIIWTEAFSIAQTSSAAFFRAMELAANHHFQIFDAMILATAAEAGCSLLLTEDMHEGFTWNGVTVTNPFKPNRHVDLESLLDRLSSSS